MWQAAIPVGLAAMNMIFGKVNEASERRKAQRALEEKKAKLKQQGAANAWGDFADKLGGSPLQGIYGAQRNVKAIDDMKLPESEGGASDYAPLIGALAQAGGSIAAEGGSGIPDGVDENDADYEEFVRARGGPRSGKLNAWEF